MAEEDAGSRVQNVCCEQVEQLVLEKFHVIVKDIVDSVLVDII